MIGVFVDVVQGEWIDGWVKGTRMRGDEMR